MRLEYHIEHLYAGKYCASTKVQTADGVKTIRTTFHTNDARIKNLMSRARVGLSGAFFIARKKDPTLPSQNRYDWDGDVSNLPKNASNAEPVLKVTPIAKISATPESRKRLLEVKKVNNVWTIIKHETELLTWEEACNLLKERIDYVQNN